MNTFNLAYIELYNYDTHGNCVMLNSNTTYYLFESGFTHDLDTFQYLIETNDSIQLQNRIQQLYRAFLHRQIISNRTLEMQKEELQRNIVYNRTNCSQCKIRLDTLNSVLHFNRHTKTKQLHLVEYIETNCNCLDDLHLEFDENEYSSCVHLILHTYKICILQRKIKKYLKKKRECMKLIQNPSAILYKQVLGVFPKYIQKKRHELRL